MTLERISGNNLIIVIRYCRIETHRINTNSVPNNSERKGKQH